MFSSIGISSDMKASNSSGSSWATALVANKPAKNKLIKELGSLSVDLNFIVGLRYSSPARMHFSCQPTQCVAEK